jgi:hypothetical protein
MIEPRQRRVTRSRGQEGTDKTSPISTFFPKIVPRPLCISGIKNFKMVYHLSQLYLPHNQTSCKKSELRTKIDKLTAPSALARYGSAEQDSSTTPLVHPARQSVPALTSGLVALPQSVRKSDLVTTDFYKTADFKSEPRRNK